MMSFKKHKINRKFEKSLHNFSLDATRVEELVDISMIAAEHTLIHQ